MDWMPLPIGIDSFEKVRRGNYYFVDKTLFIKGLLDLKGEVNLFTRPRRFGKTLNLSMLRYFFERGEQDNAGLFKGLKIMDAGEKYLAHRGKIERLIAGGTIIKPIREDIIYDDVYSAQDNLWNILYFAGYLKKIREEQEDEMFFMEMAIPNSEVRYIYRNEVLR